MMIYEAASLVERHRPIDARRRASGVRAAENSNLISTILAPGFDIGKCACSRLSNAIRPAR